MQLSAESFAEHVRRTRPLQPAHGTQDVLLLPVLQVALGDQVLRDEPGLLVGVQRGLAILLIEVYRHRSDRRPRSSSSVLRSTCLGSRSGPGRWASRPMVWADPPTSSTAMVGARSWTTPVSGRRGTRA